MGKRDSGVLAYLLRCENSKQGLGRMEMGRVVEYGNDEKVP